MSFVKDLTKFKLGGFNKEKIIKDLKIFYTENIKEKLKK